MRAFSLRIATVAALSAAGPLHAQWPGELSGTVLDARLGTGVPGVLVEVPEGGLRAHTDGAGRFRIRGLEPGVRLIRFDRLGYLPARTETEIRNGRVARLVIRLEPDPLPVPGIRASAARSQVSSGAEGFRLTGEAIRRSGARTVGDALRDVPGVVVSERGRGGAQVASIRGSGADAVLVLVDGTTHNDPLTGEADLSTLPASAVRELTVLPGARSARYGPGAAAGVVIVETGVIGSGPSVHAAGGSLGRTQLEARSDAGAGGLTVAGGASFDRESGSFDFDLPREVGGGRAHRSNADVRRVALDARAEALRGSRRVGLRVALTDLERGLPGKGFNPSPTARQDLRKGHASLRYREWGRGGGVDVGAFATVQNARFRDPSPPLGLPFDDRSRFLTGGLGLDLEGRPAPGWGGSVGGGIDVSHQRIRSPSLGDAAPDARTDASLHARASVPIPWTRAGGPTLVLAARVHRDGLAAGWYGSHDVTLTVPTGGLLFHASHRSAYSPPSLGDQFFQEGVAIRPNPGLRPERVPGEAEVGVAWSTSTPAADVSLGTAAYSGRVKGMIVWMPDFRFVWSPGNVDVDRSGADVWGEVRLPGPGLELGGRYSLARVTYDRPGDADAQVAYRPRHTGSVRAGWVRGGLRTETTARYVGRRFPVPSPVNALPGFWTVELAVSAGLNVGRWSVEPELRVDRLLNHHETLIFGYPDPGRTVLVSLTLRRGATAAGGFPASGSRTDPPDEPSHPRSDPP